jgi:hypothetical protein
VSFDPGAFAFGFIAEGIKRLRQRRIAKRAKRKGESVLKGKLTYGALGGIIAALSVAVLGDGVITEADLNEIGQAALALVAVYGRWRATKG